MQIIKGVRMCVRENKGDVKRESDRDIVIDWKRKETGG